MDRKWKLPGILLAGLLIGCDSPDRSSGEGVSVVETSPTSARPITAALLATCQEALGRRAAGPGTMGVYLTVDLPMSAVQTLTDTLGRPLASGHIQLQGTGKRSVRFNSDGKDSTGRPLPQGHYFLFIDVRDSNGVVVKSISPCLYWAGGN